MARELFIDPAAVQARRTVQLGEIPVNAYATPFADEVARHGADNAKRILRDLVLVREFELMLDAVKRTGSYLDVSYTHLGPAHLSIGQEAQAVGQAYTLDPIDLVFGSHRSHGEVIAKGLSALAKLPDSEAEAAFKNWSGGDLWRAVDEHIESADAEQRGIDLLMYGMAAETFGRSTGFNRGLGGSMHAFFPPLGIYPNNAIVGGSAPLATGAALQRRLHRRPGIVVASIGDASTGTGPVLESFGFASMGQLRTLMDEAHAGGLPVVFFVVNNFYGMGGQPIGETMAFDVLSRIGAGVNPERMHAQTINGNDPFAVIDAMEAARAHIDAGTGPVLIDCQTYRLSGHSPSDASSYRTKDELEGWRNHDPIATFAAALEREGVADESTLADTKSWAEQTVRTALEVAIDPARSPRLDLRGERTLMANVTFNNSRVDTDEAPKGETSVAVDELPHLQAIRRKDRRGIVDGEKLSGAKAVTFRDAIFEAIVAATEADDRITLWGEENRDWGGSFGVYRGLTEFLPRHRLFNSPISEAAIIGTGVGFALAGGRPLVELMYADFMGRAGDELFNQMAKWQAMSGGLTTVPMVVRISVGAKYGAQHSQDWSGMAAAIPGLKVVFPATASDAKGLLLAALRGNDPVLFFESQRLYDTTELIDVDGVPIDDVEVPIGEPRRVREGDDVTILSVGATLYRAIEAAERLEADYGMSADVIDARSMVPFNYTLLLESVRKTGRLLCVSDASLRGSWMQSVASVVQSEAFDDLDAPVTVIGARNWIAPPAELEWEFFVTPDDILDAISEKLVPLEGRAPSSNGPWFDQADSRLGI